MIKLQATAVCGESTCKETCQIWLKLVQEELVFIRFEPRSIPKGWKIMYFGSKELNARCPLHSGMKVVPTVKKRTGRFGKLIFDD
jgi:hypothetical protein